jgi:Ribbon-helix-helix protein, copG family
MIQNANETLGQKPIPKPLGVSVRIPRELDAVLERSIAGTNITKQEAVEMALREWLKVEA